MALEKYIKFTSTFDHPLLLRPSNMQVIKPDKKYRRVCHIKTDIPDSKGRHMWFHVKHSVKEVLYLYTINK